MSEHCAALIGMQSGATPTRQEIDLLLGRAAHRRAWTTRKRWPRAAGAGARFSVVRDECEERWIATTARRCTTRPRTPSASSAWCATSPSAASGRGSRGATAGAGAPRARGDDGRALDDDRARARPARRRGDAERGDGAPAHRAQSRLGRWRREPLRRPARADRRHRAGQPAGGDGDRPAPAADAPRAARSGAGERRDRRLRGAGPRAGGARKHDIAVEWEVSGEGLDVVVNRAQIHQVLLNIILNARDAMESVPRARDGYA